jgi:DNA invertase Pin-like site-specific DNA recombinase
MPTVAIYARYSSDRQNERSIGDQVAVCSRHAEQRGWSLVRIFSDAAISGAALANRPGMLDALASAERGEFDILLCEDEDRIARNTEHLAHVANRMAYVDVTIATLSTDEVQGMHVAWKGMQAQEFLKTLGAKTRRGMRANAERGAATGSRLFGYRSSPGGAMEIVEAEADVIRRIFADYLAGRSPREIANDLNREGHPGPRGQGWAHSTVCGSRQRGNGILHTEIYAGVKVWNRMEVRKHPTTGKRTPRMKPESEWKRTPAPHLRIVDDETWARARVQKQAEGAAKPHEKSPRPAWLFSGLVKCVCGASYTVYTSGKLVCAAYREKGPSVCANRRTPNREEIQSRVLEGLRARILQPEVIADAVREHHHAAHQRRQQQLSRREPLEKRLAEIIRSEARTIDAIERGTATAAMEARMMERDVERRKIEAELQFMLVDEPPIQLHPETPKLYGAMVGELQRVLAQSADGATPAKRELIDAVRGLIDKIVIAPTSQERGTPIDIILHGKLAAFLDDEPAHRKSRLGALVAGASYTRPQPSVRMVVRYPLRAS